MGYTATQHPDGTWSILDVPIFAEVPKGARGSNQEVGREWMEEALRKARFRREKDGYIAPLHVHHTGPARQAYGRS